jgi:phosphoribosylamine---glycine ligase
LTNEKINVLVVGSGGREHAIAWKLLQSDRVRKLFVAPGNGGTAAYNVPISSDNLEQLAAFANENDCLTLVGHEAPLCKGLTDLFRKRSLSVFGPSMDQAKLESSKSFAKQIMSSCGIKTAKYKVFSNFNEALDFASTFEGNVVVKADGLAKGKGVFVCSGGREAESALDSLLVKKSLGEAGKTVLVEERLSGYEVSLMALCDGKSAIPFGTASDYKRLLNGNRGPNTGGMGSCSPAILYDEESVQAAMQEIVRPVVSRTGFRGFLYAGLMISGDETFVLEFNARLGDPETQAIVPRMNFDLLSAISEVELSGRAVEDLQLKWSNNATCCVVMCSEGYPGEVKIGHRISGLENEVGQTVVFHSGTRFDGGDYVSSGGRVLSVIGIGKDLATASKNAYLRTDGISWQGELHRSDIGRTFDRESSPKQLASSATAA